VFAILALFAFLGLAKPALAKPTGVSVVPPDGARFLVGQKFDLRVEGYGKGPFSATLKIDGKEKAITNPAPDPKQPDFTDGISEPGWGGFNLRGYSNEEEGTHSIEATFKDRTGTVRVCSSFDII
jgi:hypothetical protein